ncbi:uncharacterized protein LOC141832686 [Curcuma longa]|uniref:uncharacterized protein LOC141832686 n=1 Tax=Curcuma longa TaxID=136217 RepID=UPI003D9EF5C0
MATEVLVYPIDHASVTPAAKPAAGSTRKSGWMATTARAVGGACLRVLESPAAGTLIITSVCLSLWWQHKKKKPPPVTQAAPVTRAPPVTRSMSIAMLQGGDKAMQRFKLLHGASLDEAQLKATIDDMRRELEQPRIDFVKLYACVGVVEMSGKEKEVIKLLEDAIKNQRAKAEHTHEIHELELLLVEMNIYQREYKKALSYSCLQSDDVSSADARVPLYRAVIHTMLNQQDEARKSYEKMREIRSGFHGQKFFKEGSSMLLDVADFNEFEEVVKRLKREIQDARAGTPAAKAEESKQTTVAADRTTEGKTAQAQDQSQQAAPAGEQTQGKTAKAQDRQGQVTKGKTEDNAAPSPSGEKKQTVVREPVVWS